MSDSKVSADREILLQAHDKGGLAVPAAFVRLSGPGWLQSAITLGGGSLSGALFLGVLGGTSMLWLQLIAITMGVIMLSAISYVTLSTGKRPFQAINEHVNPILGCGWLLATMAANIIWCMPQFSLSFEALNENLIPGGLIPEDASESTVTTTKLIVSAVLFVLAFILVVFNERRGILARVFDWFLKALVGVIVLCFFGVVIYLIRNHGLDWKSVLQGFIPNFSQWNEPAGKVAEILSSAPADFQEFWRGKILKSQRDTMIAAAATAVGINMTFLLPYSMLSRGWDRPFRGLARFDLATGMAIPYVLVTSCVVIASAFSFHGQVDEAFLSDDPAVMATSPIYAGATKNLQARVEAEVGNEALAAMTDEEKAAAIAALPEAEKKLSATLVKRSAFQLSKSLEPLLKNWASYVFGIGVLGMGFSTIIILMLINGYVFRELAPAGFKDIAHYIGCAVAGIVGACWPLIWKGDSQFWFTILASTFGIMLLPIAYISFFFLMNNSKLLGEDKPKGASMIIWNVLMLISVAGAVVAAGSSLWNKYNDPASAKAIPIIIGAAAAFAILAVAGFAATPSGDDELAS